MSTPIPKYVTRDRLLALLQEEVATLDDSELAWWRQHSVSPFAMRYVCSLYGEMYHFVVAVSGSDILVYSDGYNDEFVYAKREAGSETMRVVEAVGTLKNGIYYITH